MIDYRQIGAQIRKARLSKGLTQEQLAAAAGIGVTHMSHIETGSTIPSLKTLIAIVNALDCSMDALLCFELSTARPHAEGLFSELLRDCSEAETKILWDTVSALRESLRRSRNDTSDI